MALGRGKPEVRRDSTARDRLRLRPLRLGSAYPSRGASPAYSDRMSAESSAAMTGAAYPAHWTHPGMAAPTVTIRVSSSDRMGHRTIREVEASPSRVTFLPDGTVITREELYPPVDPALVEMQPEQDALGLQPTTSGIQFPNSALAPPPPPTAPTPPSAPKPDLSKVARAEVITPGLLVKSPYPPHFLLDVRGLRSGSLAQDPASKKIFRVP